MIFSNGESESEILGIYSVAYPSELACGVLIDMEGHYAFLSEHVESHREAIDDITDEDTEHYDMSGCDIEWDKPPHSWILNSLCQIVVASAEEMLE